MSKYDNLSKEELRKLVEKQDKELASKKYGLVWDSERELEQVVLDCANNLPVLKRVKGKEIRTDDSEDNILIEGDNYHALTVLNYTHKGKIDVIYIDPPYNRGNNDFKYNDRFIDKENGFRHSMWLSFMEKRLKLSKNVLKKDGVIFISIDENEFAQLKLLCDKIFGETNFLGNLIWKKRGGLGSFAEKNLTQNHEYVLVYRNDNGFIYHNILGEKRKKEFKQKDKRGKFRWMGLVGPSQQTKKRRPNLDYGILYDFLNKKIIGFITTDNEKIIISKKHSQKIIEVWLDGEATWLVGKDIFAKYYKKGLIEIFKEKDKYVARIKNYLYNEKGEVNGLILKSMLSDNDAKIGMNTEGTKQIREILFPDDYSSMKPKPVSLIKFLISTRTNKNSIILDFFAGTGTTGHAVLELNKGDNGNRKFILCSNNEDNNGDGKIMDDICYPRIKKVIKGYKKNGDGEKVEGLGSNLQYFKTSLIKKTKNQDQVKVNLTQKCTEMLCVKENIFNLEKERQDYKIFSSNKKDKFLCVYYNFLDDSFNKFLEEIKKLKGKKIIYMFSVDNKVDKSLFASIDNFTIEAIPQKILDVYKQLVKMNVPVKTDVIFLELNKAKVEIFNEKEKDAGARRLRIVLEKLIQKVAQNNGINILNSKGKEEKISTLNDKLKHDKIFTHIEWEENKTYLAIGNHASHGDNDEYNIEQVENFYKHIQSLLNNFNV